MPVNALSSFRAAALAVLVSVLLLPGLPVRADAPLAAAGGETLTQGMVANIVGIWQLVAGRPLAPADRQAIAAVDADIFRRDPAWLAANARAAGKALTRLRRADAVSLAGLRQNNLTDIYCTPQTLHMSADDAARMQAVIGRYVPIVGVDAASGAVITQRDIDAWVAATRFVAAQAHVPGVGPGYRANLVQLARDPATLGPQVRAEAVGMERDWAALQLLWPHLSASERAQILGQYLPKVKTAAAAGRNHSLEAAVALQASQNAYDNYPYDLDPRLAAYKRRMDMRMGQFQRNMINYDMQSMMQSQGNYQRSLRGEEPDTTEIPLPVP